MDIDAILASIPFTTITLKNGRTAVLEDGEPIAEFDACEDAEAHLNSLLTDEQREAAQIAWEVSCSLNAERIAESRLNWV